MSETKPSKIPSAIAEIILDEHTYKGTGSVLRPSFITYIFGNNGTGKTTISRAVKTGNGVKYNGGKTSADFIPLVYNQDFIDANVRSYHNLKGVFTFNEDNGVTQDQIDAKMEAQTVAGAAYTKAKDELGKKTSAREQLTKDFYTKCWNEQEEHRKVFDATQERKKKSEPFTKEVMAHTSVQHNWDELKRSYDSAFSSTAHRYDLFPTVEDASALDSVAGRDILGIVIVNAAETGYSSFLKDIDAALWVQEGHKKYHEAAGDKCPYCGREYKDYDFEKIFAESFDQSYTQNSERLDTFLADYKAKANEMFLALRKKPSDIYPAVDLKPWEAKLNEIQVCIQNNIEQIQKKVKNKQEIVIIEDTAGLFQELLDIIAEYNKLIADNNDIVAAGPKKQKECTNRVFEMMRYELDKVISDYTKSDAEFEKEITALQIEMNKQSEALKQINADLKEFHASGTETETAKNNINRRLMECGFSGIYLGEPEPEEHHVMRPDGTTEILKEIPQNTYAVIRTSTGKPAENLSEGEKNFIAFLYFYEQVFGNETDEFDSREKIVVIDDPVSSMDSKALFAVGSFVRKMIAICHNSYDNRDTVVKGNFIKQIIILTHNAFFHNEVAGCYQNDWYCTTYYLLQKHNEKSKLKLCDHKLPEEPSEYGNYNPVKHHYASRWDEYKEVHTNAPLMNVCQSILEHYFIQLSGYDGIKLRDLIFTPEHIYDLTHDENGNEDTSRYDTADRMLQYMTVTTSGINDGIYYVDDMNEETIRDIFHQIFKYMHQEQHYDMMMGIK